MQPLQVSFGAADFHFAAALLVAVGVEISQPDTHDQRDRAVLRFTSTNHGFFVFTTKRKPIYCRRGLVALALQSLARISEQT